MDRSGTTMDYGSCAPAMASVKLFEQYGVRAGIPDRLARQRTINLYLDKDAYRQALDLPDEDHIYVLLIDGAGHVLWRERGIFTPEKGAALTDQIAQALPEAGP